MHVSHATNVSVGNAPNHGRSPAWTVRTMGGNTTDQPFGQLVSAQAHSLQDSQTTTPPAKNDTSASSSADTSGQTTTAGLNDSTGSNGSTGSTDTSSTTTDSTSSTTGTTTDILA